MWLRKLTLKHWHWGKQYENDARALFEFTSGVNVTESPIIYRDESMRTACSPDGFMQ